MRPEAPNFVAGEERPAGNGAWLAKTRPAPGPGGLRRPLHFARAVRPADDAYFVKE